jgi:hypothetical protein
VAAPVELDVLLPELYQSSHLAAFRAQRAPHVRREVQELIPTDALGGSLEPRKSEDRRRR